MIENKKYLTEENFMSRNNEQIMQYCFCYTTIYEGEITENKFKCLDREGQTFYWIDINKLDKIKVLPKLNPQNINNNTISHTIQKIKNNDL